MAERGRPKAELVLSDDERHTLERWARRPKSAQALALRCRIVLECAAGSTNRDVSRRLGVSEPTVSKWRRRFIAHRLEGLHDEPRPGVPRSITDDDVEALVVATLEQTPTDAAHWSTRSMAKATGMSQSAVSRIWRAFGLKPHLIDSFKLSPDPHFVEKVRDVVGLYLNPPEGALVLCVDEKTQIQALDRIAPVLPLRPGLPERRTHDYVRGGTTNLYAALDIASGQVIADMTERHRALEFRAFLNLINRSVPEDLDVHVVVDNPSTHKTPEIHRWLLRHPRFTLHFTPTCSSWMNLSSAGSPNSPTSGYDAAPIAAPRSSRHRSNTGPRRGTKNPSRLSGTRAPTRSSTRWLHIARGSPTHDISGRGAGPPGLLPVTASV